ncbi:adenylosuccinate lyase [bacterium]|nr:adenylosuccinate lyase [bacterium]
MIDRYSRPKMKEIWSDENRFKKWLEVEIAVLEAQAELEEIEHEVVDEVKQKASFTIEEIRKAEEETHHEMVAFINVIQSKISDEAKRWFHFGLTSSDIMDTALALQLREASDIIAADLKAVMNTIKNLAHKYRYTPIMGRTHGMHAEPTTFGLKVAVWYDEFNRHKKRFKEAVDQVLVGKISGAVGNFATIDPEVEEKVLKKLKLKPEKAATQIVHRDRHAFYIATLALIASTIEKIATEIRNLQRTEIAEVEEPFAAKQKGSSAMPHKRNPVKSEQLCGLARLVRSYVIPAMENIVLWHERDISHSSVERVILPDATTLIDYMLDRLNYILSGLRVNTDKMMENIMLTRGHIFSQRLMHRLIRAGLPRETAYLLVQGRAMASWAKGLDFREEVIKDGEIRRYISLEEIEALFDLDVYIRYVNYIFKRVFGGKR